MDLSEHYGDKKFRKVRVRGLINTLDRYKFTIEENTPFDQEVALDPELCGKVFENLLAAYNPETGTTARKATGSFYTPREIVNYMVDESLMAYLKGKLEQGDTGIPACASPEQGDTGIPACASPEQGDTGIPACASPSSPQTGMSVPPSNRGVRALPNLETKFVAANTLIGIEKPKQLLLRNPEIDKKEAELRKVREKHFTARTLKSKAKCREDDKRLRSEIAEMLKNDGWDNTTAKQLAAWDPYDQNAHAEFFDSEWMFGVRDGFDVVIGNPPYVVSKDKQLRNIFAESIFGRPNLYGFFIHACIERYLSANGIVGFINPRTLLSDAYFSALRRFILKQSSVYLILNIVDRRKVFESVLQSCIVSMFSKNRNLFDVRLKNVETKEQISKGDCLFIPRTDFIFGSADEPIFVVAESSVEYGIFRKIAGLKSFAQSGLTFTTGKIQWDLFAQRLRPEPTRNAMLLIWAENIQRFQFLKARLRVDKQYLKGPLDGINPIRQETIIVQRTTAVEQPFRIIATIVEPKMFGLPVLSENHTSYLTSNIEKFPLAFVLGLLNSRFLDYIFRHINSNTQVSAGELNSLPIEVSDDQKEPIVKIVDRILAAKAADPAVDTSVLERDIDERVYRLYGLTAEEIKVVEGSGK